MRAERMTRDTRCFERGASPAEYGLARMYNSHRAGRRRRARGGGRTLICQAPLRQPCTICKTATRSRGANSDQETTDTAISQPDTYTQSERLRRSIWKRAKMCSVLVESSPPRAVITLPMRPAGLGSAQRRTLQQNCDRISTKSEHKMGTAWRLARETKASSMCRVQHPRSSCSTALAGRGHRDSWRIAMYHTIGSMLYGLRALDRLAQSGEEWDEQKHGVCRHRH
ncbi:hypothetical protein C8Q73DRAFT_428737 [Cubamyces lactineus]|nr:hypothetical protein C8Q73DRAFT_428737 [Cubamyces lactineus]